MKRYSVVITAAILMSIKTFGQSDADAIRYSQFVPSGTARSTAMGAAFGALGSDFASLSINPAGIGLYRYSEMTMSPSLFMIKSNSDYDGNTKEENKYQFNFGNIGAVAHYVLKDNAKTGWLNWDFGIGYNRLNDFNSNIAYEGSNKNSSYLDYYLGQVNNGVGVNPGNLANTYPDANLAYQTWLIDTIPGDTNHYRSAVPFGGTLQRRTATDKGSMGEINFAFGANYSNKIYLGASLGIVTLRYIEDVNYTELDDQDTIAGFKSFTKHENLTTHGSGVNFKLGMIYRPVDFIRFGISVQTPTFLGMHDKYSSSFESDMEAKGKFTSDKNQGEFDYQLTTPLRVTGSLAVIIGKHGALSVDYEMVDYASASLTSSTYDFFDQNDLIQTKYTSANNLRAGGEFRYGAYSVRGGVGMYGTPFASGVAYKGADMSRMVYSGGLGISDDTYFVDIAYQYQVHTDFFRLYKLDTVVVPGSVNKLQSHTFMLTLGMKF